MKKTLTRKNPELPYFFFKNEQKIYGVPDGVSGDLSNVSGNLTDITGNLYNITGNIDDCEITEQERITGININDLIQTGNNQ